MSGSRAKALGVLTGLALLAWVGGCRESDAVAPGGGSGDDSDDGDCPYSCVSQLFCVQAEGIAHGEHDCVEQGEICCDMAGGPDADSDSDSDTDGDTDTGEEPCPYECMTQYMCNATDGQEHEGYSCDEAGDVCCEAAEDTDTGYKGSPWSCLICERPHPLVEPAADQGAGILTFIWDMITGN